MAACNNRRMSYTTRCPACGTTFKVVPDQLKISDGWVRCGYCSDVFDATLNLQHWPAEDVAPVPAPQPSPAAPAQPPAAPPAPASSPPAPSGPPAAEPPAFAEPEEDGWEDLGWRDSDDFLAELQRYARQTRGESAGTAPGPAPVSAPASAPVSPSAREDAPAVAPRTGQAPVPPVPPPPVPVGEGAAAEPASGHVPGALPGFVVQARRRAFWSSPGMRVLLLLAALLLGGLLLAQWAWHERDRVAARWPSTRPLLQSACGIAGCEIAPVRRIDGVVIDSSHLARRLGTFYTFNLVLRNQADVPVAVPALELSLTDPGNQVLSRRVFLARELPGAPVAVPARGSLDLALSLSISLADAAAMSGYQAVLFYP